MAGSRLVLVGIGVSAMINSFIAYAPARAPAWDLQQAMRWLSGSVNGARLDQAWPLLGARYVGTYFFATRNDTGRSNAAALLDAAYRYDVSDSTQLSLNVHNLTDERLVVGRGSADFYNPGRTVSATLRHSF